MPPKMIKHIDLEKKKLARLIRKGEIGMAGNLRLKIYGTLHCRSGRRMKKVHRVFFTNQREADLKGFRPCSHCMHRKYKQWKSQQELG